LLVDGMVIVSAGEPGPQTRRHCGSLEVPIAGKLRVLVSDSGDPGSGCAAVRVPTLDVGRVSETMIESEQ